MHPAGYFINSSFFLFAFLGGHGTLLGLINSFIHVIMYMYYMLSAFGPRIQKYLWWKRYLTIMQIVSILFFYVFNAIYYQMFNFVLQIQFLVVFCHTAQIQFQPNCNFSKPIGALLTFNAALFTYMFSSFYIKSYNKAKKPKDDVDEKKILYDENSNVMSDEKKQIKLE